MQIGLNSPWGWLFQVIKETGWTLHYCLWKVSRVNILMMMADQSNVKSKKDTVIKEDGAGLAARHKRKQQQ